MMSYYLEKFQSAYNDHNIEMRSKSLDEIYQKFKIHFIRKIDDTYMINDIKNEIKIIIFNIIRFSEEDYAIFCFEQTIIIISKSNFPFLEKFFENHKDSKVVSISNDNSNLQTIYFNIDEKESREMIDIYSMIYSNEKGRFFSYFKIKKPQNEMIKKIIFKFLPSILSFIVRKSYSKINKNNFSNSDEEKNQETK